MELPQAWRTRLSFRNATVVVCFLNVVTALLLLQGFISSASSRSKISASQFNSGPSLSLSLLLNFVNTAVNFLCQWTEKGRGCPICLQIFLFYVLNLWFSCFFWVIGLRQNNGFLLNWSLDRFVSAISPTSHPRISFFSSDLVLLGVYTQCSHLNPFEGKK